jgi:putative heme-binding domain-containing protein
MRLSKTGSGHMPPLGARLIDERALAVVHDWIRQLPVRIDEAAKVERLIAIDEATALATEAQDGPRKAWQNAKRLAKTNRRERPNDDDVAAGQRQIAEEYAAAVPQRAADRRRLVADLLSTPPQALLLAKALREDRLPPAIRTLVMEQALAASIDPAIRDLFEAFIPEEQRTQRLGDVVDAVALLQMEGDLERGRKLFHESTVVACRNCHQIGGQGKELGPPLDAIGKKYDRRQLLESILQPSKQIDAKYAAWLVETGSGLVITGLMVEQTDAGVVIRDAQNKLHRVAAADIEGVYPQTKSLMPEMQLRDFTAQQAADLLEYLASLKAEVAAAPTSP